MHYSRLTCIAAEKNEEIKLRTETAFPSEAALADLHLSRAPSIPTAATLNIIPSLLAFIEENIITNFSVVK